MEGKYFVYVMKSETHDRFYVGMSQNVRCRLKDHNAGRVFSTKGYRPWKIIWSKQVGSRKLARIVEKHLKTGYIKERIKEWYAEVAQWYLPAGRQGAEDENTWCIHSERDKFKDTPR